MFQSSRTEDTAIRVELSKLGIDIGQTSVGTCMAYRPKPPSQTWGSFPDDRVESLVSVNFFTAPTIRFEILYLLLVLAPNPCRILYFAVNAHPTAEWTA